MYKCDFGVLIPAPGCSLYRPKEEGPQKLRQGTSKPQTVPSHCPPPPAQGEMTQALIRIPVVSIVTVTNSPQPLPSPRTPSHHPLIRREGIQVLNVKTCDSLFPSTRYMTISVTRVRSQQGAPGNETQHLTGRFRERGPLIVHLESW